jgi:ribosome-binding factor A
MVSQERTERIGQRIKEELSELMLFEVTDPRLTGIFITHVRVDRELAFANIFVSCLEGAARESEVLEGLTHAAGFLRRQLATLIQLRSFPKLKFFWDPIPENAERIDKLIDSLSQDDTDEDK